MDGVLNATTGSIFKLPDCAILRSNVKPQHSCSCSSSFPSLSNNSQMSLDPSTFQTLIPSRYTSFTLPNPNPTQSLLRIAVLDSPFQSDATLHSVAAMIVPDGRESDWIFSTQQGALQTLLGYPQFSRLVLIGNDSIFTHPTDYIRLSPIDFNQSKMLEDSLTPLVMALCPKLAFANGLPDVTFLTYEDEVICSLVVDICVGNSVGEILTEDVEIDTKEKVDCKDRKFRRRLRFKRNPYLIQTQLPVVPSKHLEDTGGLASLMELDKIEFRPDIGVLVHPYLTPMVAGLSLIAHYLDERIQHGFYPRALCVGVGGGALVSFLNANLGFEVVGVEMDEMVLRVARQYFGLNDSEFVRLIVGDGIKLIEELASQGEIQIIEVLDDYREMKGRYLTNVEKLGTKFDVIMVDLDSCDARFAITAPPLEFVKKPVLQAAKSMLHESGILVINVLPPNQSFYDTLTHELLEVFPELYEIDVGNGDNFVLIAAASSIGAVTSECENSFLTRLRSVSGVYIDSIVKT